MLKKIAVFGVATLMSAGAAWAQPQQGAASTDERLNVQQTPSMMNQGLNSGDKDVIHGTVETTETVEVVRPVMTPTTTHGEHWRYFERGFTTPTETGDVIHSRLDISTDADNFVVLPDTSEADVINSLDSWDTLGSDDDDVIIQQRLEITPSDVDRTLMDSPVEQDIILERRTEIETTTPVEVDITPRHDVDHID